MVSASTPTPSMPAADWSNPCDSAQQRSAKVVRATAPSRLWTQTLVRTVTGARPTPPLLSLEDLFASSHQHDSGASIPSRSHNPGLESDSHRGRGQRQRRAPRVVALQHDTVQPKVELLSPRPRKAAVPSIPPVSTSVEPSLLVSPRAPGPRSVFSHPDVLTDIEPIRSTLPEAFPQSLLSPLGVASPEVRPAAQDGSISESDSSTSSALPPKPPSSVDPPSSPPIQVVTPHLTGSDMGQLRQGVELLQKACTMLAAGLQSPIKLEAGPSTDGAASVVSSQVGATLQMSDTPDLEPSIPVRIIDKHMRVVPSSTPLGETIMTPVPEQGPCPAFFQAPTFPRAFDTAKLDHVTAFEETRCADRPKSLLSRMRDPPPLIISAVSPPVASAASSSSTGSRLRYRPYHMRHRPKASIPGRVNVATAVHKPAQSRADNCEVPFVQPGTELRARRFRLGNHVIF